MPSTGSTYFYQFKMKPLNKKIKSVNTLNGLLLISTTSGPCMPATIDCMCQCPQRASTYFYYRWNQDCRTSCSVSMPSTGFYLFLRYPLGSLDFTGFRDLILQVINRIFCKLAFSQYFLCSFLNTKSYRYFYYTLKNIVLSMKKQQVFYYCKL